MLRLRKLDIGSYLSPEQVLLISIYLFHNLQHLCICIAQSDLPANVTALSHFSALDTLEIRLEPVELDSVNRLPVYLPVCHLRNLINLYISGTPEAVGQTCPHTFLPITFNVGNLQVLSLECCSHQISSETFAEINNLKMLQLIPLCGSTYLFCQVWRIITDMKCVRETEFDIFSYLQLLSGDDRSDLHVDKLSDTDPVTGVCVTNDSDSNLTIYDISSEMQNEKELSLIFCKKNHRQTVLDKFLDICTM